MCVLHNKSLQHDVYCIEMYAHCRYFTFVHSQHVSQRVAHCTNALLLLVNQTVEQSIVQQPTGQPHGAFQAGDKFGPGFAAGSYSASGANFKLPSPAQSKHHTATLFDSNTQAQLVGVRKSHCVYLLERLCVVQCSSS
eukprot:8376-Heterococcus_DN1.PRE.6